MLSPLERTIISKYNFIADDKRWSINHNNFIYCDIPNFTLKLITEKLSYIFFTI